MAECKVCCYAFNQTFRYPMVLLCGHTFCLHCITEFERIEKLCPLDRRPYLEAARNEQMAQMIESCAHHQNIQRLFKIALVGDQNVGKTSAIHAFKNDPIARAYHPTVGFGFEFIDEIYKGKVYRIQIWDTAGQQRYRAVQKSHYQNTNMVLVVFDLSQPKSFADVSHWLKEINEFADDNVIVLLLANKCDLVWKLDKKMLVEFAADRKLRLEVISCVKRTNVQSTWNEIVRTLVDKFGKHDPYPSPKVQGQNVRSAIETGNFKLQTTDVTPSRKSDIAGSIYETIEEKKGSTFSSRIVETKAASKKKCSC